MHEGIFFLQLLRSKFYHPTPIVDGIGGFGLAPDISKVAANILLGIRSWHSIPPS